MSTANDRGGRTLDVAGALAGVVLLMCAAACEPTESPADSEPAASTEHEVVELQLLGPLEVPTSEVSGMAWYGEVLVLLPQYPDFFDRTSDGALFALTKRDVIAAVEARGSIPLDPLQVPLTIRGDVVDGFEGYEAIAFDGDRVYVTVEASPPLEGMRGYLLSGRVASDLSSVVIDAEPIMTIHPQSSLPNMSEESVLVVDGRVITFHEVNGSALNPSPRAHFIDVESSTSGTLPMSGIEYRLTDVTAIDHAGNFWGVNTFFPGDTELLPSLDPLAETYGVGATHRTNDHVERLVELRCGVDGVTLSARAPIQLELLDGDSSRNWEGLVRLDDRGFLLVTDRFPGTVLAFVSSDP